jgi:hypothetical protein
MIALSWSKIIAFARPGFKEVSSSKERRSKEWQKRKPSEKKRKSCYKRA